MNKQRHLAFLTFLLVGLFSLITPTNFAQTTDSIKSDKSLKPCSGEKFVMPQSISLGNEAFENYLKTASPSRDERRQAFRKMTNEQKRLLSKSI